MRLQVTVTWDDHPQATESVSGVAGLDLDWDEPGEENEQRVLCFSGNAKAIAQAAELLAPFDAHGDML